MPDKIRVGSRESRLAVLQSEIVIDIIKKNCPWYDIELVTIKTTGDKILDRTLDKIGGKGLFVKELDRALLDGKVDITVHSLKDIPVITDERLPISAYTECESPFDVLVLPKGASHIDFSKPVGSSSERRNIQFKKMFPKARTEPIRGNVVTRLEKLDKGEYSALILAKAGLERLGFKERISRVFSEKEIIPAAGQGVIAVQKRKDDDFDFMRYINDKETEIRARTERAFVRALDGGCSSPVGCFAELTENEIEITGFYADGNVSEIQKIKGSVNDSEKMAARLAEKIKGAVGR